MKNPSALPNSWLEDVEDIFYQTVIVNNKPLNLVDWRSDIYLWFVMDKLLQSADLKNIGKFALR